jgi:hypothetical protein
MPRANIVCSRSGIMQPPERDNAASGAGECSLRSGIMQPQERDNAAPGAGYCSPRSGIMQPPERDYAAPGAGLCSPRSGIMQLPERAVVPAVKTEITLPIVGQSGCSQIGTRNPHTLFSDWSSLCPDDVTGWRFQLGRYCLQPMCPVASTFRSLFLFLVTKLLRQTGGA